MARDRSRTPPRSPSEPSSCTSRLARDSGHTDDLKALNCRHDDHKVGAPLKCAEECGLSSDKCHCDASLGSGHPAVGELQQKRWRDGLAMVKDLIDRRRVSIPPMSSIMSSVMSCWVWERLNFELGDIPVVRNAADTLQLTPTAVVLGSGGSIGFLLYGFGGEFVCNLLGVAYPAFESFKVVESFANLTEGCPKDIGNKASDMQFWLTYWIVAALLATFEYLFWILLIRIPFYYPLKLLLLLFLTCPGAGGTNSVYNWLVTPILRRNRHRIDSALEKTNKKFSERICETW